MPAPHAGRAALKTWCWRYVRATRDVVYTRGLASRARELGWQRYLVHTLPSELYRERKIELLRPGVYRRKEVKLRLLT
jgi:hypothetical protein